jgi:alkylation response protein AidB-like acyl-CoA dehydrogenase
MHTFADRHPQFVLEAVRVPDAARLGAVGSADDLANEWFMTERIHIGARCAGAMERLLALAVDWATGRVQFGERIYDFQGVSFPLADSAADASAARLLTREAAALADAGADPKVVHAKASLAKLFASEAAWRCADRAVQVFGGRGYMRENPAERYLRELRVDRIWEGTSEIQRLIVARGMERRGVERILH